MKYYNKPVEWREIVRTDGSVKYEVTKKVPVLECRRNPKHCYEVDPAEDRVKWFISINNNIENNLIKSKYSVLAESDAKWYK